MSSSHKTTILSLSAVVLLALSACSSTPPRPTVYYPVTYQIQLGNTEVRANDGPQTLNVMAAQDVAARAGVPLYFQVVSPVDVTLDIYEVSGRTRGARVQQLQGTTFTASVTPRTGTLQFAFGVTQANSSGTVKFTLSDTPLAPAVAVSQ